MCFCRYGLIMPMCFCRHVLSDPTHVDVLLLMCPNRSIDASPPAQTSIKDANIELPRPRKHKNFELTIAPKGWFPTPPIPLWA